MYPSNLLHSRPYSSQEFVKPHILKTEVPRISRTRRETTAASPSRLTTMWMMADAKEPAKLAKPLNVPIQSS